MKYSYKEMPEQMKGTFGLTVTNESRQNRPRLRRSTAKEN